MGRGPRRRPRPFFELLETEVGERAGREIRRKFNFSIVSKKFLFDHWPVSCEISATHFSVFLFFSSGLRGGPGVLLLRLPLPGLLHPVPHLRVLMLSLRRRRPWKRPAAAALPRHHTAALQFSAAGAATAAAEEEEEEEEEEGQGRKHSRIFGQGCGLDGVGGVNGYLL